MPSDRTTVRADRFLGVRLTAEELATLDQWKEVSQSTTRSDAIRALVRSAGARPLDTPELPPTVRAELEQLVEDGYARDFIAAFDQVIEAGLGEVGRTHAERLPRMRGVARGFSDRAQARKRAEHEGRRLLDR